MASGKATVIIF